MNRTTRQEGHSRLVPYFRKLERGVGIKPTSLPWKGRATINIPTTQMADGENFEISTLGLRDRRSSSELPVHIGGSDRHRTCNLLRARQLLSQLSYTPVNSYSLLIVNGGPTRIRTENLEIKSHLHQPIVLWVHKLYSGGFGRTRTSIITLGELGPFLLNDETKMATVRNSDIPTFRSTGGCSSFELHGHYPQKKTIQKRPNRKIEAINRQVSRQSLCILLHLYDSVNDCFAFHNLF